MSRSNIEKLCENVPSRLHTQYNSDGGKNDHGEGTSVNRELQFCAAQRPLETEPLIVSMGFRGFATTVSLFCIINPTDPIGTTSTSHRQKMQCDLLAALRL